MHVRTPSRPAWLSLPLRRMRIVLALIAVLALLLTAVQATVARAAGAPPSGTYSGTSTAYTGATVELEIDEAGRLVEFDTESYIECGLYPTAMQWAGVPATPVTADEPFDLTWQFGSSPAAAVTYHLEDVVIGSDGTATGEGYASMDFCQGYRFTFEATVEGGGGDPDPDPTDDPEPGDPTVVLDPASLQEDDVRIIGTRVRASGFPADTALDFTVTRLRDDREVHASTVTSNSAGATDFAFRQNLSATVTGELFDVELRAEVGGTDYVDTARLVVTRQSEFNRVNERQMTVAPETLSLAELAQTGVTLSSSEYRPNKVAELTIDGQPAGEVMTDAQGNVSTVFTSSSLSVGEHEAMLVSEHIDDNLHRTRHRDVAVGTFVVTEDATPEPTEDPTVDPTEDPTDEPTVDPTDEPTTEPTDDPTTDPTTDPTEEPTPDPTVDPTVDPTDEPTTDPTTDPTDDPSPDPTVDPTDEPTVDPTADPTTDPTDEPTEDPTDQPTIDPTDEPTEDPTEDPTPDPTVDPTPDPTDDPTEDPTPDPQPTQIPGTTPSEDELTDEAAGGIVAPRTMERGENVEVHVEDVAPGTDVGAWLFSDPAYLGTHTVAADGSIAVTVPNDAALGEHRIAVWSDDETLVGWTTTEVVDPAQDPDPTTDPTDDSTEDPSADPTPDPSDDGSQEPTLAITPEVIGVSAFVDAEQGVLLSVDGLEEGTSVDFDIAPASGQNTTPATLTAHADDQGVAAVSVYGVDASAASSYLGTFDVIAHIDDSDESLSGSFRVVADDDAPGGGGDGDGSGDGESLPRTGGGAVGALSLGLLLTGVGLTLLLRSRRPQA